jgi:HPt (histidine-containing phosphotransfer) domain-containing protein
MNLKEFYKTIGGNYEETLRRLMNEKLMKKYLLMFAGSGDYEEMKEALAARQWEEAFRHSHNLKGVCLNLGLGRLTETCSELCDALRSGEPAGDLAPLIEAVETARAQVMEGLRELET